MPRFITTTQGDPAWLKARVGKITASRISDVLAFNKNGAESAKRRNYRMELVAERITGQAVEKYVSPAMDRGSDEEQWSRMAYEVAFNVMVDRVGFAVHDDLDFTGASPDCLVGDDGMAEFKNPDSTTHLEYVLEGRVPEEYEPQCMWGMEVCKRKWCDFISYDSRIPEGDSLRIFCVRLDYDPIRAGFIRGQVQKFNEEIEVMVARLRRAA